MSKWLLFTACLSISNFCDSQPTGYFGGSCDIQQENANQLKYWQYRERFLRDFIKIGIGGTSLADNDQSLNPHPSVWGRSIPMNRINPLINGNPDNPTVPTGGGVDPGPGGTNLAYSIDAGDNPMKAWGLYVSVLATEIELLRNQHVQTMNARLLQESINNRYVFHKGKSDL
jgi:hypothetical protein